jgi:hypothetical protein
MLANPGGLVRAELRERMFFAKKTKAIHAKRLNSDEEIESPEGLMAARAGDYLCKGVVGECWPQNARRLLASYTPSGVVVNGWERFDPRPDALAVMAVQIPQVFSVETSWGGMKGRANDYLVVSQTDPRDQWIVAREIFEATYDRVSSQQY